MRHRRESGFLPQRASSEPSRRHGRVAHRPWGLRHRSQPRSTISPAGRWRSPRSPPLAPKFRVSLGLRHQLSLGSRCESPSPVPRKCRCAPGAQRYNAAHPDRLVARKRPTQRGGLTRGRPVCFMPPLPPRARAWTAGQPCLDFGGRPADGASTHLDGFGKRTLAHFSVDRRPREAGSFLDFRAAHQAVGHGIPRISARRMPRFPDIRWTLSQHSGGDQRSVGNWGHGARRQLSFRHLFNAFRTVSSSDPAKPAIAANRSLARDMPKCSSQLSAMA